MIVMRSIAGLSLIAVLFSASSAVAQDKAAVQKKLESEYALTKATADQSEIVTAGAVLVLQKDNLLMVATSTSGNPCTNTYKDGRFTQSGACRASEKLKKFGMLTSHIPGADKAPTTTTRTYVTGEKFWVTKIDVRDGGKDPGIVMDFFTDAVSDVRYRTSLLIPFRGGMPSADDAVKLVGEVVKVAPAEDNKDEKASGSQDKGNAQQASAKQGGARGAAHPAPQTAPAEPPAPAAAAPAEAAPAAIEPPPPPPADPPTVKLGQTPDEVVAALGQPDKKAKIATKEIYYYKDLKVTFINGKVKDIQ
jgi:hypothetical protein